MRYSLQINNKKFRIPIIMGNGHSNFRKNETWALLIYKRLISKRDGAFVDVGANVGQTLLMAKSIKPDIRYYGFEPNPSCMFYLEELVNINGISDVSIFPVAIGNSDQIVELFSNSASVVDPSATVLPGFRESFRSKKYVSMIGKGSILKILTNAEISVLKIDVEGAEYFVIEALDEIISRDRPYIVCEILPVYSASNTQRLDRQQSLENFLHRRNYKICRILQNGSLVELLGFGIHSDTSLSNYLFVPQEDPIEQ